MAHLDAPSRSAALCIHLLGGFRVAVDGREVGADAWRLRNATHLIALLALATGHRLHREQLMDALWPDSPTPAAARNLKYALHVARRGIGSTANGPWLRWWGELLTLGAPGTVWVDVEAFEVDASAGAARSAADVRAVLARYGGDLLPEARYVDWVQHRREHLRQLRLGLLHALANFEEMAGDYGAAIAALDLIVDDEPTDEAAHRALMRLHALAGRRQQALRQYERLIAALRDEVDAQPQPASQKLYQAIVAGADLRSPELGARPTSSVVPLSRGPGAIAGTGIPYAPTSFIGREREVAEVRQLLRETRLLTLTGTGGVGKTRLAFEVARVHQADFADGICVVELASLADPAIVPATVARALDIAEQPGIELTTAVTSRIGARCLLLVLDNCEHVLDACATLTAHLLRQCAALRVLVTSREVLRIDGETAWRTPSLSVPDNAPVSGHARVMHSEAGQLFVARARAVWPAFALTDEVAPAVAEICRRLDGLPLAIELAAARMRHLTVTEIAARLDDRFALLTGGSRTALARHQTLQATLAWSHGLLMTTEEIVFRRLGVFAGGWTLAAADVVCVGDWVAVHEVLDVLARLVDKSLVQVDASGDETRYRLLETIRTFALERLREAGEEHATRERHRDWCLALAGRAEPELARGDEQMRWFVCLDREHDNLRAAMSWCIEEDPAAVLALAGRLRRYLRMRPYMLEWARWLDSALAQMPEPTHARASALWTAVDLAMVRTEFDLARAWLEEAIPLARASGDMAMLAGMVGQLGQWWTNAGDYARARRLLDDSLSFAREANDQRTIGAQLFMLVQHWLVQCDYRRAKEACDEALPLVHAVGDRTMLAASLDNAVQIALDTGDYARAREIAEEGLAHAQAMGVIRLRAIYHRQLGHICLEQQNVEGAIACYRASLAAAREAEHLQDEALALAYLGWAAQSAGDVVGAAAFLDESLALYAITPYKLGVGIASYVLGLIAWDRGDGATAATWLRESLTGNAKASNRRAIARCLEGLAMVAVGGNRPTTATRWLAAATSVREAIGSPASPADRTRNAATAAMAQAALGEAAFAASWSAGAALTLEEAVALALGADE